MARMLDQEEVTKALAKLIRELGVNDGETDEDVVRAFLAEGETDG